MIIDTVYRLIWVEIILEWYNIPNTLAYLNKQFSSKLS